MDAASSTPDIDSNARANQVPACAGRCGARQLSDRWWHWSYGDRYWALVTRAPAAYRQRLMSALTALDTRPRVTIDLGAIAENTRRFVHEAGAVMAVVKADATATVPSMSEPPGERRVLGVTTSTSGPPRCRPQRRSQLAQPVDADWTLALNTASSGRAVAQHLTSVVRGAQDEHPPAARHGARPGWRRA